MSGERPRLSADPAAVPESEFSATPRGPEMGHPETDPPMVVRVESWAERYGRGTRRAVRLGGVGGRGPWPWLVVTGGGEWSSGVLTHDEVRGWPVAPPVTYTAAFRHEEVAAAQRRAAGGVAAPVLDGGDAEGDRPFRA